MLKVFILNFFTVSLCFAAGDGHGSIADLFWPAVNFSVLFGFLFYKMKDPINENYINYSVEIESNYNSAKIAEEEAKKFLAEQKLAKESSEELIQDLVNKNGLSWENQRKILESDYDEKTKKVYADFENKLVGERKKIESEISSNLLEKIIKKTSLDISNNPENKSKAMRKFLQ